MVQNFDSFKRFFTRNSRVKDAMQWMNELLYLGR